MIVREKRRCRSSSTESALGELSMCLCVGVMGSRSRRFHVILCCCWCELLKEAVELLWNAYSFSWKKSWKRRLIAISHLCIHCEATPDILLRSLKKKLMMCDPFPCCHSIISLVWNYDSSFVKLQLFSAGLTNSFFHIFLRLFPVFLLFQRNLELIVAIFLW